MTPITPKLTKYILVASISIILLIAIVSMYSGLPVNLMTQDVAAIGQIHPLYGFLSSLGILLWTAVATVCFVVVRIVRFNRPKQVVHFLYASGVLTLYLLMDDLFMFHESLGSRYFGLPEVVIYGMMLLGILAYLFYFWRFILETQYWPLVIAFFFLGTSVLVDSIFQDWLVSIGHWEFLIEDGAKWFGIVAWTIYYLNTASSFLDHR